MQNNHIDVQAHSTPSEILDDLKISLDQLFTTQDLSTLDEQLWDIVLLAFSSPEMDGWDRLRRVAILHWYVSMSDLLLNMGILHDKLECVAA